MSDENVEELVGELFADLIASVRVPEPLKVTESIVLRAPTKDQSNELLAAKTEEDAQKIIFGDQYDEAMKLFGPQPIHLWNAFLERYNEHFYGDKSSGK